MIKSINKQASDIKTVQCQPSCYLSGWCRTWLRRTPLLSFSTRRVISQVRELLRAGGEKGGRLCERSKRNAQENVLQFKPARQRQRFPTRPIKTFITLLRTFVLLLPGCSSLGSRWLFSGHPPLSMNQPPEDTVADDLGPGSAAASLAGVLQSGCPFRYRDVRELFMWLGGCRGGRQDARTSDFIQTHRRRQTDFTAVFVQHKGL